MNVSILCVCLLACNAASPSEMLEHRRQEIIELGRSSEPSNLLALVVIASGSRTWEDSLGSDADRPTRCWANAQLAYFGSSEMPPHKLGSVAESCGLLLELPIVRDGVIHIIEDDRRCATGDRFTDGKTPAQMFGGILELCPPRSLRGYMLDHHLEDGLRGLAWLDAWHPSPRQRQLQAALVPADPDAFRSLLATLARASPQERKELEGTFQDALDWLRRIVELGADRAHATALRNAIRGGELGADLVRALDDPEPAIRVMVLRVFEVQPRAASLRRLLELERSDPDTDVREWATHALDVALDEAHRSKVSRDGYVYRPM